MKGSNHYNSKLTEQDVLDIREIVEQRETLRQKLKTMTNKALSEKYGVHERTIDKVTNFYTWGHI